MSKPRYYVEEVVNRVWCLYGWYDSRAKASKAATKLVASGYTCRIIKATIIEEFRAQRRKASS